MLNFYLVMFASFFIGSCILGILTNGKKEISYLGVNVIQYKTTHTQKLFFWLICIAYVLVKLFLYKEGVYRSYAFDSGAMDSKFWTVSMGLSELLVMFFILFLMVEDKVNALISFVLIAVNLAHGTRIFTLICLFVLLFYFVFHKKKVTGIKFVFFGLIGFLVILFVFLLVFLYRSGLDFDFKNITFEILISPVVYESIFNQISFTKMLNFLNLGSVQFAPQQLFNDVILFTLPNVFAQSKNLLMYTSEFGNLSPLGGLSGYASAIIYFGGFYFIWYLILGLFASMLLYAANKGRFPVLSKIIYVYFICDTLFRLHRDPFYIVGKMFINNITVMLVFFLIPVIVRVLSSKRHSEDVCKS